MAFPTGPKAAYLALSRFGFGARADGLAEIGADPAGALGHDLSRGVAHPAGEELPTTAEAIQALDEFKGARKLAAEKRAADIARTEVEGKVAVAPDFIGPPQDADKAFPRPEQPQRRIYRAETLARMQAAVAAPIGFAERLVWFWSNHFCVSIRKGGVTAIAAGTYEREAIRPHVLGRFEAMLLAVERHPAMLSYLDNRQSIGPNSRAGTRRDRGLNENLARENLELHTLGVDGGYTQDDVTSLAKILTGWTIIGRNDEDGELGEFTFNANRHEPGEATLLGRRLPAEGVAQGEAALRLIAAHPATARHIALKLARHFIADEPPVALVVTLTKVFLETHGDLLRVSLALIEAREAWGPELVKMRSPQEFVAAALRATGAPFIAPQVNGPLIAMGQGIWQTDGPNGYADTVATWASPEGLNTRLDYAMSLGRRVGGDRDPGALAEAVFGLSASPDTVQAIQRAETRQQGLAILLMSPEMQRR